MIPFVDLKAQHDSMQKELMNAFADTIDESDFIMGDPVATFEKQFAEKMGSNYCLAVGSGTDALRLSLRCLIPGHYGKCWSVFIPANGYISAALAAWEFEAKPVLVDCGPDGEMDSGLFSEAILKDRSSNKLAMIVHMYGRPAPVLTFQNVLPDDVLILEDCAQACGASCLDWWFPQYVGSLSRFGCFSFYPSKNLGALGDGGAILVNDPDDYGRLKRLRNYGEDGKNNHVSFGYNSRLDTMQARFLLTKLPHLDRWNSMRSMNAAFYRAGLNGVGDLKLPEPFPGHVYHIFMIQTKYRDELQKHLESNGIQTRIHYPTPIHLQPCFAHLGYKVGVLPNSERLAREGLSLPMYPELSHEQIDFTCGQVKEFFSKV